MKRNLICLSVLLTALSCLSACSSDKKDTSDNVKINPTGEGYQDSNPVDGDYADDSVTESESYTTGTYGTYNPLFERGEGEMKYPDEQGHVWLDNFKNKYPSERTYIALMGTNYNIPYGIVYLNKDKTYFSLIFLSDKASDLTYELHLPGNKVTTYTCDSDFSSMYFNKRVTYFSKSALIDASTYKVSTIVNLIEGLYVAKNYGLRGIAEMIYYSRQNVGQVTENTTGSIVYSDFLKDFVYCYGQHKFVYRNTTTGTFDNLEKAAEQLGGYISVPPTSGLNDEAVSYYSSLQSETAQLPGVHYYASAYYVGVYTLDVSGGNWLRIDDGKSVTMTNFPTSVESTNWYKGKTYPDTSSKDLRFIKVDVSHDNYRWLNIKKTETISAPFEFSSLEEIGVPKTNPYYGG